MMRYQPINLNFIPKDEKNQIEPSELTTDSKSSSSSNHLAEIELKQIKPVLRKDTFAAEERNMLLDQIKTLTEQLDHSIDQISTLEDKLKDSNNQITDLTEELLQYEMLKNDLVHVSNINISMTKLSKENEVLKKELTQKKDHIQMLYFMLLVLAIL